MPQKDKRVRLDKNVDLALEYYMHEKMPIISGVPGAKMTKSDVVNQIMMNFLAEEGHYPPRIGEVAGGAVNMANDKVAGGAIDVSE